MYDLSDIFYALQWLLSQIGDFSVKLHRSQFFFSFYLFVANATMDRAQVNYKEISQTGKKYLLCGLLSNTHCPCK